MPAAATNMPALSTGHAIFPPTTSMEGSTDTFINNFGAIRVGDKFAPHGDTLTGSPVAMGSATVFINNLPAARIGDQIGCGDMIALASPDTSFG